MEVLEESYEEMCDDNDVLDSTYRIDDSEEEAPEETAPEVEEPQPSTSRRKTKKKIKQCGMETTVQFYYLK